MIIQDRFLDFLYFIPGYISFEAGFFSQFCRCMMMKNSIFLIKMNPNLQENNNLTVNENAECQHIINRLGVFYLVCMYYMVFTSLFVLHASEKII